ncbi:hypothetical protein TNCV_4554031 [Trichonephila clavipes]|nr:hypothetical protein TNCV_4554031 [Trichonephila clavipes]
MSKLLAEIGIPPIWCRTKRYTSFLRMSAMVKHQSAAPLEKKPLNKQYHKSKTLISETHTIAKDVITARRSSTSCFYSSMWCKLESKGRVSRDYPNVLWGVRKDGYSEGT